MDATTPTRPATQRIATPTRKLLRANIQQRAKECQDEVSSVKVDGMLEEMLKAVTDQFDSLDAKVETVEAEHNHLEKLLVISRRTKYFAVETGPLDTVRLVIDSKLHFLVYIYADIVEEGTVLCASDVTSLAILQKMSDSQFFVCPGVSKYSTYRDSIGFDAKDVVHVTLPGDTVRHTTCNRMCKKLEKQKTLICKPCLLVKYYLAKQKRKHDQLAIDSREEHQKSTSSVPFDYLSPCSKKAWLMNMRKEINTLKLKLKRTSDKILQLQLNEEQAEDIAKLCHAISQSEVGRCELEKIFTEAEESGQGKGYKIKSMWERDTECFNEDQLTNCKTNKF